MPGSFFDTNVLLYLASGGPAKADVINRFELGDAWLTFCRRAGIVDPCNIKSAL
jgi:hypothetical protein